MGIFTRKNGALALCAAVALGVLAAAVGASPPVVMGGRDTFRPNRTSFAWSTADQSTSSDEFRRVSGLQNFPIKHYGPLVATVTLEVSGEGRAQFSFDSGPFKPKRVTFDPSTSNGSQAFSFSAVLQDEGWTCADAGLRWRSPSGRPLELHIANVVVDYKVRKEAPDFACR